MPRYPSTNKLDALRILGQCLFRLDKFKALVKFSVALILPRNPWILVGHALRIAWNMLLFRPDNVKHLVNSCVPFVQRNPSINLVDALRIAYGDDYYICKFQIPGEIEAELDRMGVENFMKRMLTYRTPGPLFFPNDKGFVGGGSPDPDTRVDLPSWLNEEDVAYYVSKFEKTGFTGGINYYRALNLTWQLTAAWNGAEAKIPAKFVIGDLDLVYHMPGIQDYIHKGGFKSDVPLLKEVVVIKDAAHFINQEIPDEINKHIYDFIRQF
ncbi:OLC1v1036740C1 [Oldenlandia corymbosa var. corymbosa]|uniref:OLC1v1036740C1 n=1 Tax=Oldenlandia corymbosa var. corymbosa TaxID=529605 RepID=A0AAV1CXJ5_OLDCO|nr:OLC1v1036740C1 [Oldenlandia corymbosa var. corymbosa]